eukprot:CAMPEP_0201865558 /NCGR_PEP_ID=MMETSP0902-20130614/401_1 /ASSEMBLY_ACC=CAM_ASM_000551 /TAXON_ID=420261 /ORGANISM="Thalassiosira antarctica, Strain CCMP982" /LENGTH=153 /DNA_ID=CAMNT_0048390335 /DNA_START=83 /DNA_END=544 /DNA_ORIENTATION=-
MKAITHFFNIFFFVFTLLANVSVTAVNIKKNKFDVKRALQAFDPSSLEDPCPAETEAFGNCLSTADSACAFCPLTALLTSVDENGDVSSNYCVDLQKCADESCPEECHDEMHASSKCLMQSEGDSLDCSPGFKANVKATIASAVGAVIGLMLV